MVEETFLLAICITRSSVSSMCSMSMLCGSLCSSSSFDCSICGRNCWTRASTITKECQNIEQIVGRKVADVRSVGGSTPNVLRSPKSNDRGSLVVSEGASPFNLSRIFSVGATVSSDLLKDGRCAHEAFFAAVLHPPLRVFEPLGRRDCCVCG